MTRALHCRGLDATARRFGKINVNRFFTPVERHPEVAEVRKEPDQKRNIGSKWHTDHSYDDAPALGSMCHDRWNGAVRLSERRTAVTCQVGTREAGGRR